MARLTKNQKYIAVFEEEFGEQPYYKASYYLALGGSIQYKWLIKDRWSIAPMILCDLGFANGNGRRDKISVIFNALYFDIQGRLYLGYRF